MNYSDIELNASQKIAPIELTYTDEHIEMIIIMLKNKYPKYNYSKSIWVDSFGNIMMGYSTLFIDNIYESEHEQLYKDVCATICT
jgi:tellurite resistance protein TehA-like permease